MITESSIEIEASAEVVWRIFSQVERWPKWTASVGRVTPLDGPDLAVGRRYEILQPRFPRLVWTVTELDTGRGWIWRQRSPGSTALAVHEVVPLGGGRRTLVRQRIDQRGPGGLLVGFLSRRLTRRYLAMEAEGLKRASEAAAAGPEPEPEATPALRSIRDTARTVSQIER
ncbi:MAG: SRPBCC family protein [Acidimicrobiia bacterium]|nr:SRPBCC family protein [Acidimicrobiia bacterium]